MANDGSFRSALNGFNRQDVTDYLESASARYNALKKERGDLEKLYKEQLARVKELEAADAEREEALAALREKLETANAARCALEEELLTAQSGREALEAQLSDARSALDAAKASLAEAAKREADSSAESDEMKALRVKLEETGSKAAEYDLLRQRLATLELDASRRAAEIERTAREEAEDHRCRILAEAETAKETALLEADAIRSQARKDAEALRLQAEEQAAALAAKCGEASRSVRGTFLQAARDTGAEAERLRGEAEQFVLRMREFAASMESTAERFAAPAFQAAEDDGKIGEVHHCHVDE